MAMTAFRILLLITISLMCENAITAIKLGNMFKTTAGLAPWRMFSKSWSFSDCQLGVYSKTGLIPPNKDRYSVVRGQNSMITGFAIYDGHSDGKTSTYAEKHLLPTIIDALDSSGIQDPDYVNKILNETIVKLDQEILSRKDINDKSGSTAAVGILAGQKLYIAHVGDTKAVAHEIRAVGRAKILTDDHRPFRLNDARRVKDHGGIVEGISDRGKVKSRPFLKVGFVEIGGRSTHLTRSLGDRYFKPYGVIAEPTIAVVDWRKEKYDFVVLGTSDLWKRVKPVRVVQVVSEMIQNRTDHEASKIIWNRLLGRTRNDITLMVVQLPLLVQ